MSDHNINLIPLSKKHYEYFEEGELVYSVRGWVAEQGSKVYGLGGIILAPSAYTVFLKIIDNNLPKLTIYKLIKKGFNNIKQMNLPIFCAIKDKELDSAERLLAVMGFVKDHESKIGDVYIWRKQQE
jgi:formyltetrahydrofolate synthetase